MKAPGRCCRISNLFQPLRSGFAYEFKLEDVPRRESNYAIEFSGFIKIIREGEYTFYLNSDDGTKLIIDETELITNDGTHAPIEKSGKVSLKEGLHPVTVLFFQAAGGETLEVSFEGPGIEKQAIPAGFLFRDQQ